MPNEKDLDSRVDRDALSENPRTAASDAANSRCAVCGWPLATSTLSGCVRGNCSMRPLPMVHFDPDRAQREYRGTLPASARIVSPRPYRDDFPEHAACLQALEAWRTWAQFVYLGGGPVTLDDDTLRLRVNETHDRDVLAARAAERSGEN